MMVHFILVDEVILNVAQVVSVELSHLGFGTCTVRTTAAPIGDSRGAQAYIFRGAAAKQVAEFFTGLAQELGGEQVEK